MSADINNGVVATSEKPAAGALTYEPPVLESLGNVRDLVAGASGPYTDADTGDPQAQNFP